MLPSTSTDDPFRKPLSAYLIGHNSLQKISLVYSPPHPHPPLVRPITRWGSTKISTAEDSREDDR